jgi:hypothetical protein
VGRARAAAAAAEAVAVQAASGAVLADLVGNAVARVVRASGAMPVRARVKAAMIVAEAATIVAARAAARGVPVRGR